MNKACHLQFAPRILGRKGLNYNCAAELAGPKVGPTDWRQHATAERQYVTGMGLHPEYQ